MTSFYPNHLLANRKRLGLSQTEVAFLLGIKSGETVCRHERFERTPSLEKAFAYEVIFKKPARELFPGLYENSGQQVADRARLLHQPVDRKNGRERDLKRRSLSIIGEEIIRSGENE